MELIIENVKNMSYKDFEKAMKEKYNLLYKGSEGIVGLYEFHKFKVKNQEQYFSISTDNITELAKTGRTIIEEW